MTELVRLMSRAKSIVITSHKSPDGDSMGCSLGLFHFLLKQGYPVTVCHPDMAPSFLHWMPGSEHIVLLESEPEKAKKLLENADLIFCLDYHHPSRTGKMEELLVASKAGKIIIDHHRDPDQEFATLLFSDITASSTSQLIYDFIEALDRLDLIDEKSGTCIYTGLVTDTGSFRFSATSARTHHIAGDLINRGIKTWQVHENLFDTNSLNKLKMVSYALLEKLVILPEYKTAYIWLTRKEEERFQVIKGDTEGLVNQVLSIEGIRLAGFFKEADQIIKISFRSKGEIPANQLCKMHFEGGGHLNASGGKYVGKIEDAVQKFVTILPNFVEENKALFE
ncbi:MAG: DHH family phosphoesterase [Bacteroidetes bacterium]|nr:DHH family phosphoesterase [Bacteroidota bacterium]